MKLHVGVKVLLKNRNGQFLFIRRAAAFAGEDTPHWDIPGGRINPEEPLLAALAREIKEETGLEVDSLPELQAAQDIFVPHADLHVVRLTYSARGEGEPRISEEHQEVAWMTKGEALSASIDPYVRDVLDKQKST